VHSRPPSPVRTTGETQALTTTSQPRLRSDAGSTTLLAIQPDSVNQSLDADNALSGSDALLLQSLHSRMTALRPPLADRLDELVDLFNALKMAEHELMSVLRYHQPRA
jgi:hypothetical protein